MSSSREQESVIEDEVFEPREKETSATFSSTNKSGSLLSLDAIPEYKPTNSYSSISMSSPEASPLLERSRGCSSSDASPLLERSKGCSSSDASPLLERSKGCSSSDASPLLGRLDRRKSVEEMAYGGTFCRHRSSMSKTKVKELKQKVARYEEENANLKRRLQKAEQRISELLHANQYYVNISGECENIQIGNNNSMTNEDSADNMMEAIGDIEALVRKLTSAVEVNIQERVSVEDKLETTKIQLEELRKSIQSCTEEIKHHDETSDAKLEDIQQALQTLTTVKTDQTIIKEGMVVLKSLEKGLLNKRQYPTDVKELSKLMMNKFGSLHWREFAEKLEVDPSSIDVNEISTGHTLDQETCVQILLRFLESPSNNADKLVTIIKMYDEQKTKERVDVLRRKTICCPSDTPTTICPDKHQTEGHTKANDRATLTSSHETIGLTKLYEMLIKLNGKVNTVVEHTTITKDTTMANNAMLRENVKVREGLEMHEEMFV